MGTTLKTTLERRNPDKLKNHPVNAQIYGTKPDDDFVEDIRKNGVTTPLLITADNVVIGGHRRRQAALMVKLKEVPVLVVRRKLTENEIIDLLLTDNRYRDKTNEQKAREFEWRKKVEADLAKERQKLSKGRGQKGVENFPHLNDGGKARDKAAEEVGMSGKTAEKAAKVVQKIDEAEAAGDTETAEHLRETLNKSVSAAAKEIEPKDEPEIKDKVGNIVPAKLHEAFEAGPEFDSLCREANKIGKRARALADDGFPVRVAMIDKDLRNISSEIRCSRPHAVCVYCKGKGGKCDACKGLGWLTKTQWANVPGDKK